MAAVKTPRDQCAVPLCGARKKNGEPCRNYAGSGSRHKGYGKCMFHGGLTPSHNAHAAKLQVRQKAGMGEPIHGITPGRMLQGLLALQAGDLLRLAGLMAEYQDDLDSLEGRMVARLYQQEKELSLRIGKVCADAGIEERMVSLAESQTAMVATLLEEIAEDLNLSTEQKHALGPAVRRRLSQVQSTNEVVEGTAA